MITSLLYTALIKFLKVLPVLIVAIVVSQIVNSYMSKKKIKKIFKENETNLARASSVGVATPGPLLAFLPFLKALKNKGLPLSIIAAFITGQTLIGPGRLFLEISYFGVLFFVYRVALALLIAVAIANCFRILEKYVKF